MHTICKEMAGLYISTPKHSPFMHRKACSTQEADERLGCDAVSRQHIQRPHQPLPPVAQTVRMGRVLHLKSGRQAAYCQKNITHQIQYWHKNVETSEDLNESVGKMMPSFGARLGTGWRLEATLGNAQDWGRKGNGLKMIPASAGCQRSPSELRSTGARRVKV